MRNDKLAATLKEEASHTVIYLLNNFVLQFGNLLVLPLFWKKLTPSDYGIIAVSEMVGAVFGAYANMAMDAAVTRFYYQWPEAEKKKALGTLWITGWLFVLVSGFATFVVIWLVSPILFSKIPFFPFLFMGMIHAVLFNFRAIPFTTLRIQRRPLPYCLYSLTVFTLTTGLLVWEILFQNKGLKGYYLGNILAAGFVAILCAFIMSQKAELALDRKVLKDAWKFAYPYAFNNMLVCGNGILDRFLLQMFSNLETLGIYALALKFTAAITSLHDSIKLSYGPFVWKSVLQESEGKWLVAKVTPFFVFPIFVAGAGMALFVRPFVQWFGPPAYQNVALIAPVLAGVAVMTSLYIYYSSGILISGRTKLASIPTLLQSLVLVGMGPLLIQSFALRGILALKCLSASIFLLVAALLARRVYPIPYDWSKPILLGIMLGLIITFSSSPIYSVPAAGVVFAAMVGGGFWILGLRTIDDIKNAVLTIAPRQKP